MAAEPGLASQLEERWRQALVAKDEATLRSMIHPDYELVAMRANGAVSVGLEAWMEALHGMDLAALEMRVIKEVSLPHTIVATVSACWNVRYRGQCINERVLLTDVWVREDGDWQVIRRHSSLVPVGVEVG